MNVLPMGDAAWRIELPEGADHRAVLERLRSLAGVTDVVVADRHALVRFLPGRPPEIPPDTFRGISADGLPRPLHRVPVRYDGPDLAEVAETRQVSVEEVIRRHAGREYTVQLVGFLPGFAYLGPLDPLIDVPRRPTPRPRVPAGAVSIAAGRTGVYPFASPGGWHILGAAVDFQAFDPGRGCVFQLGDRVRFEPVS